jgi:hypothetical protein
LPRTRREIEEIEAELVLANQRELEAEIRTMPYLRRLEWAGADRDRLKLVQQSCGYRAGWTYYQLKTAGALA